MLSTVHTTYRNFSVQMIAISEDCEISLVIFRFRWVPCHGLELGK